MRRGRCAYRAGIVERPAYQNPRHETAALSSIVVTWNSSRTLERCVRSCRAVADPMEIVVVDNASSDDSAQIAEACGAVAIRNDENRGFAAGVNIGLARCTAPLLLLLNPDVVLEPGAVERCVHLLDRTGAGIVGANLRTPDGRPDRAAARRFKSVCTVLIEALGLPTISPMLDWQHFPTWDRSDSREVPCVNGAFMLMRTDLLRELGGLDESVFMYLEDLDLCWRVRERGLSVWFCADAIATHVGGTSTAAGNIDQQSIAHLHRLDGTIEFVVRTGRPGTRIVVVALLVVQSLIAGVLGTFSRDRVRAARHWRALPWLARQFVRRQAPPRVPSS